MTGGDFLDATVLEFISRYGLWAVFVIIALEYACFPVPSELVLPFAGAVAASSGKGYFTALLLSVAAGLLGSLFCYAVGRFGGTAILKRLTRFAPRARRGAEASVRWFERHGHLSVMIGRVLPLFRTYISFAAGISRQNPVQFCAFSAVGIAVWNAVLIGLGFLLGENWQVVTVYAKRYSYVLLPVVVALLVFIGFKIYRTARSAGQEYKKDQ